MNDLIENADLLTELISVTDRLKLGGIIGILDDNDIFHYEESSQMNDQLSQVIFANVHPVVTVYVYQKDLETARELLYSIGESPTTKI